MKIGIHCVSGGIVGYNYFWSTDLDPFTPVEDVNGFTNPGFNQPTILQNLVPNGLGKITYKDGDQIIEEYEGEFHVGQYNGQGKLVFKNKVYKGLFLVNQFVEEAEISSISDA